MIAKIPPPPPWTQRVKRRLPLFVIDWLRKIRNGTHEFLFKVFRTVPLLKRYLFYLYCQEEKLPPSPRLFSILRPEVKKRFNELGCLPYNVEGIFIELNPFSLMDRKIISGMNHDPIVTRLIRRCLSRGGTFLDIGANIGFFSLIAAKLPGTKVLAFEPSPRELSRFRRNMTLNQIENIQIFPFGLAHQEGKMPLYLWGMENPANNSVVHHHAGCQTIKCHFMPLDHCLDASILSHVRLCKIDVEGSEISVLKGMTQSIQTMEQTVFVIEIIEDYLKKAGHQPEEIYRFFKNYGYRPIFGYQKLKNLVDLTDYNEVFSKTRIDSSELCSSL